MIKLQDTIIQLISTSALFAGSCTDSTSGAVVAPVAGYAPLFLFFFSMALR
jgi:hypothetical protein